MFKGEVPGHKVLGVIMRCENVSISWLTDGVGAPYLVHWSATDEECRRQLDEFLDFQDWTIHLLTDGGRVRVLVLYAPAKIKYKGRPETPYTDLNVLAGVGRATVARLANQPHRVTYADTETVAAVASGEAAGTWTLLGDDGLLRTYQCIDKHQLQAVAEDLPGDYVIAEETDAYSAEERRLVELHRRLDPKSRVRWKEVGDAFAAADRSRDNSKSENEK